MESQDMVLVRGLLSAYHLKNQQWPLTTFLEEEDLPAWVKAEAAALLADAVADNVVVVSRDGNGSAWYCLPEVSALQDASWDAFLSGF